MEPLRASNAPPSLVGANHLTELLAKALLVPPGCFVEVGVYKGGSAYHLQWICTLQKRHLYLYDTFTGIPCKDAVDSHSVGDFADCDVEDVRAFLPDATVIQGVFPACAAHMPPIAFAHLDCDQYESVRDSAVYVRDRMVPGGIIWFDDSPILAGAARAVAEIFPGRARLSSDFGKHYVEF